MTSSNNLDFPSVLWIIYWTWDILEPLKLLLGLNWDLPLLADSVLPLATSLLHNNNLPQLSSSSWKTLLSSPSQALQQFLKTKYAILFRLHSWLNHQSPCFFHISPVFLPFFVNKDTYLFTYLVYSLSHCQSSQLWASVLLICWGEKWFYLQV